MRVELIDDENPSLVRRCRDRLFDMRHEISLGARGAQTGRTLFARGDLEVGEETLGAVANVFVFQPGAAPSLTGYARLQGFAGRGTFERLDAGLFIGAHQVNALCVQARRFCIQVADRLHLRLKLVCVACRCIEPVLSAVWLQIELILKNARRWSGKYAQRSGV